MLFAVLGVRAGFFDRELLQIVRRAFFKEERAPLPRLLVQEGLLSQDTAAALEVMVDALVERFETPARCFEHLPLQPDPSLFEPSPTQMTILEWRGLREKVVGPEQDPAELPVAPSFGMGTEDFDTVTDDPGHPFEGAADLSTGGGGKYVFVKEIGRGALGRVMEAMDSALGREVAVKMMLEGKASASLVERFLLEGRITGRLSHPGIVPVHEIGVLRKGKKETPYFTMARIQGKNLAEILDALEKDDPKTRRRFTRYLLLRVFQEVCFAVHYAHHHGVIHRDLKPANIMVGDYGEVYVVDWGLAKNLGESGEPESAHPQSKTPNRESPNDPGLTMDGQVMGTPAYMPPEQAGGYIHELDARSDVYSLGAILYQILTFRPPFEGDTVIEVVDKVRQEVPTPPSQRATEVRRQAIETGREPDLHFLEDVPATLEDICLKAMARNKEDRYGSAQALSDEIQSFLDGEKERKRNQELAAETVERGRELVRRHEDLKRQLADARKSVTQAVGNLKPWWPAEKKAELWRTEDRVEELKEEVVQVFTRATATFRQALGFVKDHALAREALADLYWEKYQGAVDDGDISDQIFYENLVREYNDGQYDERLRGEGRVSVQTRSYPCACLEQGREVRPEDLKVKGFHPFSGRLIDGHAGAKGIPDFEPHGPVRLRVHGPDCRTEPNDGADVWLFRHQEKGRLLLPVMPHGISIGVECGVSSAEKGLPSQILNTLHSTLDTLYDSDSPFRPGPGLYLGQTPTPDLSLPMGSYLLIVSKKDHVPLRIPFLVERLSTQEFDLTLYREREVPAGFVVVPAGSFSYQGDKGHPFSLPREERETGDFFLARTPVTCREYIAFLNASAASDPKEAASRVPREAKTSGHYWPWDGRYRLPTKEWRARAPRDKGGGRLLQSPVDWEEDWPVLGISWEDAQAYTAWRRSQEAWAYCLPLEDEWEKAARGPDRRLFPWGNAPDESFCNMNRSHRDGMRPVVVDAFAADESPYGVRGMAGNSYDPCLNDVGPAYPTWRYFRGGAWGNAGIPLRAANTHGIDATAVYNYFGVRLSVRPVLS